MPEDYDDVSVLSHFDSHAIIADISDKDRTDRTATASGKISMRPETFSIMSQGTGEKGDVLSVAYLAGIMATKRTADLIPFCHLLPLTSVRLEFIPDEKNATVYIEATVKTTYQTGVEMEALTAVSVAALTIYDMLKTIDRTMEISEIRLNYKAGGKSGIFISGRN